MTDRLSQVVGIVAPHTHCIYGIGKLFELDTQCSLELCDSRMKLNPLWLITHPGSLATSSQRNGCPISHVINHFPFRLPPRLTRRREQFAMQDVYIVQKTLGCRLERVTVRHRSKVKIDLDLIDSRV